MVEGIKSEGKCPECGNEDLDYKAIEVRGQQVFYPFKCKECDTVGEEWYKLKYDETIIK